MHYREWVRERERERKKERERGREGERAIKRITSHNLTIILLYIYSHSHSTFSFILFFFLFPLLNLPLLNLSSKRNRCVSNSLLSVAIKLLMISKGSSTYHVELIWHQFFRTPPHPHPPPPFPGHDFATILKVFGNALPNNIPPLRAWHNNVLVRWFSFWRKETW